MQHFFRTEKVFSNTQTLLTNEPVDHIAREEPHNNDIHNEETTNDTPPSATTAKTYPILTQPTNRYVHTSHKQPKKLKMLNVNCQSVVNKVADLLSLINTHQADIIVGTESWLTNDIHDNEIFPNEYTVYRKDRVTAKGGGVFILVRSTIPSSLEPDLSTDCEIVWARINAAGSKALYIGAYYRSQTNDLYSLDQLDLSLNNLSLNKNRNIVLAGDFNFPGYDWQLGQLKRSCINPSIHRHFISMMDDLGLQQMISEPTRGTNTLDLILTNNPSLVSNTTVVNGISDHDCCLADIMTLPDRNTQKPRIIPLHKKADWASFEKLLTVTAQKLQSNYESATADVLWKIFKDDLLLGIHLYIPTKTCKQRDGLPWINNELRKLMNKRDRLYTKQKNSPEHLELKRLVQLKTRRAYWDYIEGMITPNTENENKPEVPKKFWTYIKHCKSNHKNIPPLKSDGILHHNSRKKADILNNQFKSVFTHDDHLPIPPSAFPLDQLPSINDIYITEPGVLKLLQELNVNKATGPDGISPRVMKTLAQQIAPCLTKIFNKSLQTSIIPNDWRTANVTPIYKKGGKHEASNYRPVSLTCISSKIMEHIITSRIMNHASDMNILYNLQHGFRSKLSCETQLIEFVDDLVNNMSKGVQTDVIVMDFSKAFDKVCHRRLLHKLRRYGIDGRTGSWIEAFLSNRSQRVVVGGESSEMVAVQSGVPQGSVLGPALFLFYINDIAKDISSTVRLFADDTILYKTIQTPNDAQSLQGDLDKLASWGLEWKMEYHPEKCQIIKITRNRNVSDSEYKLNGVTLSTVKSIKYLGVTISSDLCWNDHIDNITTKANKTLSFVRRNIKISSPRLKTMAYFSLVRPLLEYVSTVWDPHTTENVNKIEMIQRRAARYVTNQYERTASVTSMLQQLDWRSLENRRTDARLCLFYKIVNNLVKIPAEAYLTPLHGSSRLNHSKSYQRPCSNADYHLYSFFPKTIRNWNNLPHEAINSCSLNSFKNKIRNSCET